MAERRCPAEGPGARAARAHSPSAAGGAGTEDGRPTKPEEAEFTFNWLSATGTGIFLAAVLSAVWLRIGPVRFLRIFGATCYRMRWPLVTIACMLAIAYVTRYSGMDATLGLAFTHTGWLYPFFAALLGWLGVALTGSDTSSNALFGSLQTITAEGLVRDGVLPPRDGDQAPWCCWRRPTAPAA